MSDMPTNEFIENLSKFDFDKKVSLQTFIDKFPFYVLVIDEEHKIYKINKAVAKAIKAEPSSVIGNSCQKLLHGNESFCECPLNNVLKTNMNTESEFYVMKQSQWVKSCIYPLDIKSESGKRLFIDLIFDITHSKETYNEIVFNLRFQNAITDILNISLENLSLEEHLNLVLKKLLSIPWLESTKKGAIFLVDNNPDVLVLMTSIGLDQANHDICRWVEFGQCLCGKAALYERVEFSNSVDARHTNQYDGMKEHGHYCVPIFLESKVIGVLNIHLREDHEYNQKEEKFLISVAKIVTGIIKRDQINKKLVSTTKIYEAMESAIQILAMTVEKRDPYTAGHQRRVGELAHRIAKELAMDEEVVHSVRLSGIIHDVGKISIPSEILSKPGKLTDIEFELIKTHSQTGYEMLKPVKFPWPVAQIVLQHHERMDGSGYPHGLKKHEILDEAKILGVADVVEAIASDRPYRAGLGVDTALEEIDKGKVSKFDEKVVEACIELFVRKNFKFES